MTFPGMQGEEATRRALGVHADAEARARHDLAVLKRTDALLPPGGVRLYIDGKPVGAPKPRRRLLRSTKYSMESLEIGESLVVPWEDGTDQQTQRKRVSKAATARLEIWGEHFKVKSVPQGIKVTRVP